MIEKIFFPWDDILNWYSKNWRHDLPWRQYKKYDKNREELLYRIWISEVLLQQTQVERVIPYLGKILARFPHIHDLAKVDYDTFFPYYKWMGYYSRARNILKTAKIVSEEYSWIFPDEWSLLKKLPWVWEYTSSAIRAFWYEIPLLAWDTNLDKVFSRYFYWRKDQKITPEEKNLIQEDFKKYVIRKGWENIVRDINNGLMDFSRIIDLKNPESIDWENYPITSWIFYETKWKNEPREVKKWIRFPTADAHVVVVLHRDHKAYFSSNWSIYSAFILPWVWENDTRKYVQKYFIEKYNLELSVRPVHKKWMWEDDIPYIAVNAQIQAWDYKFSEYKKEDIQDILSKYKK